MTIQEKQKMEADIQSQIRYAVGKYGGSRPPSLVRAEAEMIARKAMKSYVPGKGSVKTHLSSRLQKMSRTAYKASSALNIPEKRLMGRAKLRDFIDGYKDTHGFAPSVGEVATGLKVSQSEASRLISEYGAVRAESVYSGGKDKPATMSHIQLIKSLPVDKRSLAEDIFIKERSDASIMNKHKIKRSTYMSRKKEIIQGLKSLNSKYNIERV